MNLLKFKKPIFTSSKGQLLLLISLGFGLRPPIRVCQKKNSSFACKTVQEIIFQEKLLIQAFGILKQRIIWGFFWIKPQIHLPFCWKIHQPSKRVKTLKRRHVIKISKSHSNQPQGKGLLQITKNRPRVEGNPYSIQFN
ncbi:hypothetical protein MANES_12G040759v8 [Manihot esculenta]|uniref:Uncharacterized protein n=1 Tax=Manihot esculenta TaxID=3983 RepID=A0ACB7GT63_MANES|nr:hypothetical protein MANES_12G040759v8 [Manihot esculenta]